MHDQILNKLKTILYTVTCMGEKVGLILQEGRTLNLTLNVHSKNSFGSVSDELTESK